jgi:hypothetical protein
MILERCSWTTKRPIQRRETYVLTSFEWDDRAKTARFRMGEEAAETLRVWWGRLSGTRVF